MPEPADISSVEDHGDSWTVVLLDGEKFVVPQSTSSRHGRAVLQWIAEGGTVDVGEVGKRRRLRAHIENDPVMRVLFLELAAMSQRTPQQTLTALLSHLD